MTETSLEDTKLKDLPRGDNGIVDGAEFYDGNYTVCELTIGVVLSKEQTYGEAFALAEALHDDEVIEDIRKAIHNALARHVPNAPFDVDWNFLDVHLD